MATASVVLVLALLSGCLMMEEEPLETIGSVQNNLVTENALTENALTANALTANALTANALTANALAPEVFELNYTDSGDLQHTSIGRFLLKYITRCAYESNEWLALDGDLGPAQYAGRLGLATIWKSSPLSQGYKEIMSACLLAHLNNFGTSVPISVRYNGSAPTKAAETNQYYYGDGVYYGDIYQEPAKKYACTIRQKDGATPVVTSSWSSLRVCAQGNCGIVNTGYCDEVCSTIAADGSQWKFSDCHDGQPEGSRTYYSQTFTVWLEGDDGPACKPGDATWKGFSCRP